ncbi:hypothetical protein BDR04DRAFT_1235430 [Suillus decipiens]|nr:hypothetical protein BDR04DRAFT_1235430 [Suillus decipiens]
MWCLMVITPRTYSNTMSVEVKNVQQLSVVKGNVRAVLNFSRFVMSEDHRMKPPPEASESPASESKEATPGDWESLPRSRFRQALQKFKNVIKKVSKPFKRSRHRTAVVQNADHEVTSSNQNVEDVSRLHPSNGDKSSTSEHLSDSVNQGAPAEPTSKVLNTPPGVEETPDSQLVDAQLRNVRGAKDGPKDLPAADDFQTTHLRSIRIFDTVIKGLADVHPYAKVVLGMLAAASKTVINRCNLFSRN